MDSQSFFSMFSLQKVRSTKNRFGPAEIAVVVVRMTTRSPGLLLNSGAGQNSESIEEWLQDNRPSNLSKYNGIGWIWVQRPEKDSRDDTEEPDVVQLQESWEKLQSSGRTITVDAISSLAKMYKVTSGKWLFHVETGFKADMLWATVAKAVAKGDILATQAKISPHDPDGPDYTHVVCIYNKDYLNYEQVLSLENDLRKIGLKCLLHYKPDVFTYLGIYRNNAWGLRPTLYTSNYDLMTGRSVVKNVTDICL